MRLFTSEYVKKEAVKNNKVLFFLYVIATPLSRLLIKLRISPNIITVFSILFAILSFLALIFDDGYLYFCVFWALSTHLDFCDGTVARITGNINKTAFRFDHNSDIFKLTLVIVGASIRYNDFNLWIFSMATLFSFLYMMLLNHDISAYSNMRAYCT